MLNVWHLKKKLLIFLDDAKQFLKLGEVSKKSEIKLNIVCISLKQLKLNFEKQRLLGKTFYRIQKKFRIWYILKETFNINYFFIYGE